MQTFCFQKIT
jgi:hypothetical protein